MTLSLRLLVLAGITVLTLALALPIHNATNVIEGKGSLTTPQHAFAYTYQMRNHLLHPFRVETAVQITGTGTTGPKTYSTVVVGKNMSETKQTLEFAGTEQALQLILSGTVVLQIPMK